MNFTNDAPAIVISRTSQTPEAIWHQVLLGIEEEGIPWQWQQDDDTDAIQRAWQAATRSPLLVGLACSADEVVVHYRNLPPASPLFRQAWAQDEDQLRRLGNNAARLVKGLPFKFSTLK
ncbi:putative propanediol utilization diol dehydratase reactivation protein [Yersinia frederiksenii]|uniref:Glycerol dehydratase reactivase beta/small subunit family protein n=1 Tax=Yersinia alsatica TaxID=2890317 RepID=A0ABY5ULS1_9GAMM|nr:glycerol dehydratase reactivase beta/small subunit family protein [Yersinia alsatica]OWF67437.1 propanediol dehydratase [Yersinia frederiksenii]UWM44379.1 glycerol dehydratase reactivase beta/small subunit family protein [Yersinia alsatica]CFQ42724.1 putative propanediol utilization diol dehydratase reactivation protein [Yersinia frederiksenii]CNC77412.1 putative propanediol utilization diol dehydratase reactivation protein [Yersinia frederiksenii]CNH31572.1 putative propanediol utilization